MEEIDYGRCTYSVLAYAETVDGAVNKALDFERRIYGNFLEKESECPTTTS